MKIKSLKNFSIKNSRYRNRFRWYSPDTGRYIEVDNMMFNQYYSSINHCNKNFGAFLWDNYKYTPNNPVYFFDKSGMNDWTYIPIPFYFGCIFTCIEKANIQEANLNYNYDCWILYYELRIRFGINYEYVKYGECICFIYCRPSCDKVQ